MKVLTVRTLAAVSVVAAIGLGGLGSAAAGPWDIRKITNIPNQWKWYADVSGPNVACQCIDGDDYEIYLYNYADDTTVQVTDNTDWDDAPSLSGSNVVWTGPDPDGFDAEVFWYDGSRIHHHGQR